MVSGCELFGHITQPNFAPSNPSEVTIGKKSLVSEVRSQSVVNYTFSLKVTADLPLSKSYHETSSINNQGNPQPLAPNTKRAQKQCQHPKSLVKKLY